MQSAEQRRLRDAVIVITGASSGIGRATALACARQGAALALAARNERALREVAEDCRSMGGSAVAIPTDVGDEHAVHRLAERARNELGRLDVWINNAGVSALGIFEETPPDAFRQVFETNFFGTVHGSRAALQNFREQNHGVLINVSSMVGRTGVPYLSAYTASKFAIRGFTESLRMEHLGWPNVHICTILPPVVDTPLFQHAANYTGRAVKPMNPVYRVEDMAEAIMHCAAKPRPEVRFGKRGQAMTIPHGLSLSGYDRLIRAATETDHFQDRPARETNGNVFSPSEQWLCMSGGWSKPKSGITATYQKGGLLLLPLAAAGAAWLVMRNGRTNGQRVGRTAKQIGRRWRPKFLEA